MRYALLLTALAFLYSCAPVSKGRLTKTLRSTEEQFKDHTGFFLYDPENKKTLVDFNGSRYFTPASNTKIFTFYASLKILGDSVPGLEYIQQDDSLIFWGTGDPSFLNKNVFNDSTVYNFLKTSSSELYFSSSNFHTTHLGEGWAWDDYNSGYSAERSAFPLYGNVVSVVADQHVMDISPRYFTRCLRQGHYRKETTVERALNENVFTIYPSEGIAPVKEFSVPFRVDSLTFFSLLSDTLKRPVKPLRKPLPSQTNVIFSLHADSLYKVMMQESDNFIAEQLLMMCANVVSDSLEPGIAINYVKQTYLNDLPDPPVWVDGSGLSRYNLFTPRSIVRLWEKIWQTVPRERLFHLLATGGVNGTIKRWYTAENPYIFGKTGSLSNNHCLSGFLVTKKGKVLIFSFMNSNYTVPTNDIRSTMQDILGNIYEHY